MSPSAEDDTVTLTAAARWGAAALFLLVFAARLLPGHEVFAIGSSGLLGSHLLLETAAIVVALLVVITAFFSLEEERSPLVNSLILAFSLVAGCDFVHALSYQGMPAFLGQPNGMPKAALYWLAGRLAEVAGFALLLARIRLPGARWAWLLLGLAGSVLIAWLGDRYLLQLPPLFVPGLGVTPLKAATDYGLAACYIALAWGLLRAAKRQGEVSFAELAKACYCMGMAELALTGYVSPGEWQVVLAHVCKVVAYVFVFRAIFLQALRLPYRRLQVSQRAIVQREQDYRSLVENLPLGVVRLNRSLHFLLASPMLERSLGISVAQMQGRRIDDVLPAEVSETVVPALQQVLQGDTVDLDYGYESKLQGHLDRHMIAVPDRAPDGSVQGVLMILRDSTARMQALRALQTSSRETRELKLALDAHAIVAITDRRGVILEVNDKFCAISKYPREELLGKTHAVINSGHHPKSFWREMWATIGRGNVWNDEICNRAKDGSLYWVQTTIVPLPGASGKVERYIAIRADISKRKQAEQEAQRLAFFDVLTGLPNRRLLTDRLQQTIVHCQRKHEFAAVVMIDLDHFKEINDTLGHDQGDALLRQVADRLQAAVRRSDTVSRLGGDEFVLLLTHLGTQLDAAVAMVSDLGEMVRDSLSKPYSLGEQEVVSTPSLGVTMLRGDEKNHVDELFKRADLALYKAKDDGRNLLRFYDPVLQDEINQRTALIHDLRRAIELEQLRLLYQPIVNQQRQIVGVEALMRWQHPQRGVVSPAEFIPLAEQSQLILPMGRWALHQACAQIKAWEHDPQRAQWTIAVNVSARQLHEPNFVAEVEIALADSGIDPTQLRLELTESQLQTDLPQTTAKMRELQQHGIRFSLDDFGTGYSSLSYLKRLPLEQFKIDRSFVQGLPDNAEDASIAKMVLALSTTLELQVVAEGVETEAQFEFLKAHGCQKFQGYLFGKPMPPEALAP